jgi:hypothetical protein
MEKSNKPSCQILVPNCTQNVKHELKRNSKRTHQQIPESPLQQRRKHLFAIDRNCLLPSSSSLQIQQKNKSNSKSFQPQIKKPEINKLLCFFFSIFAWTDDAFLSLPLSLLASLLSSVLRMKERESKQKEREREFA